MLMAPLTYPNPIFASATPRFRTNTRLRTPETADARDRCSPAALLEDMRRRDRPPPELYASDDVFLRHHSPVTAVGAVVAVIAHDEIVTVRNDLRSVVVVAAELWWHVVVVERDVVHIHAAVDDTHVVAFFGDH